MSPALPLVLFDGVCNLCNQSVQWLVDRDPNGRLHFASLQSDAARNALAEAGVRDAATIPDSIVLVDTTGVHVRSTAVLRIARLLGFPYTMALVGFAIPRPLRDALYRFIARHRYRWFGRRDTCMRPTPELSSRFLDAEEPVKPIATAETQDPDDAAGSVGAWISTALWRFAIVYVLIYMLPFPLTLLLYIPQIPLIGDLPGLGTAINWIVGLYSQLLSPFVTWVGAHLFGVDATPAGTGSGDRTFNYVMLAVQFGLSTVITAIWVAVARVRAVPARVVDFSRVLSRYYLGTTLLTYGWFKVFPLQFPLPGPERLLQPYGDSSPMGIAWAFLGASQGYQIFAGLAELLGGYLLFWRRTALLGALVSGAVMINVTAINYFYDVPVKLFSTHLLLVAMFIMAPDLPRLVGLFGFNLSTAPHRSPRFWTSSARSGVRLMAAHLLLIGTITTFRITGSLQAARSYGFLMEPAELTGIYRIESFERAGVVDRDNNDDERWVKVGISAPSLATIQRATGDAVRMRMSYDEEARTLSFFDRGGQPPAEPLFTYTIIEPGLVRLEGSFDGQPLVVVMRLNDEGTLLLERGYHWINEFPFNR